MAKKLGEILIETNVITEAQLQEALILQKGRNVPLGQILVEMKLATEQQIASALKEQ